MSIHDDPTQDIPGPAPRKRRWYRRWYVITPAALAVGIITISAIGGTAAKSAPVAKPSAPPASSAPASPGTGNNPSPAAPYTPPTPTGPDQLTAGQTETLTKTADGTAVGTVTVAKQAVTTYPADSYGEAPANGYYVIVKVTAAADAANHDGWFVSPLDFHAVVHGQHYDEGNGHAYEALTSAQSGQDLSSTLSAGETATGYLAFDVPKAHGTIVYAPNSDGQPLAVWSY